MLMGLFVLLGFGLLFMYASHEGGTGKQSIESLIAQQAKDVSGLSSYVEDGEKRLALAPERVATAKELKQLKSEIRSTAETISRLEDQITQAEVEIASRSQAWEEYKDQYRAFARGNAKGETLEQLKTVQGTVYTNVNIREVTAIGIQIRHDEGHKRIAFEDLPEEMKDRFQFDPAQKEAAAVAEAAVRSEHDAAAAVANRAAEEQMAAQRDKNAADDQAKARQNVVAMEAQIAAMQADITRLESDRNRAVAEAESARRSGKMHINKSGSIGIDIQGKQGRLNSMRTELTRMKAALN